MSDLRKAAEQVLEAHDEGYGKIAHDVALENLREALAQPEQKKEQEPEWIEDGFGTMWQKCGKKDCGKFVVKIGKVDCWNGDCPEAKERT